MRLLMQFCSVWHEAVRSVDRSALIPACRRLHDLRPEQGDGVRGRCQSRIDVAVPLIECRARYLGKRFPRLPRAVQVQWTNRVGGQLGSSILSCLSIQWRQRVEHFQLVAAKDYWVRDNRVRSEYCHPGQIGK